MRSPANGAARYLVFAPDGRTVATYAVTGITLWQVATGQEFMTLRPARYWLRQVTFAADGQSLVGVAHHPRDDGTDVTVWPANGQTNK